MLMIKGTRNPLFSSGVFFSKGVTAYRKVHIFHKMSVLHFPGRNYVVENVTLFDSYKVFVLEIHAYLISA
jgi:hypothetical protein